MISGIILDAILVSANFWGVINLQKLKISSLQKILWIVVMTFFTNLSFYIGPMISGFVLFITFNLLLYIKNKSLSKNIFCVSCVFITQLFVQLPLDYSVMYYDLLDKLFGYEAEVHAFVENYFLYISSSLSGIIVITFSLVFGKLIHKKSIFSVFEDKKNGVMISVSAFLAFIVLFTLAHTVDGSSLSMVQYVLGVLVVSLISLSIISLIVISSHKEVLRKRKEEELSQLMVYTSKIESIYKDMRRFKHDNINVLSSMIGYMDEDDMDGLVHYFKNIVTPYVSKLQSDDHNLGILANIGIVELKGMIASKILRAHELNISVNVEIVEQIKRIDMDIIELCRAIGILLDNAIEASMQAKEKIINIALMKHGHMVTILISNTYEEGILPLHKIYTEGASSKGDNRGFGLSNFKNIINKYDNILSETTLNDGYFTQTLRIDNVKCIDKLGGTA